jgi:hypothetical protein
VFFFLFLLLLLVLFLLLLFFFFLLLLLQHSLFFAFLCNPKNRQIVGVFSFFDTLKAKNTVNTDVFWPKIDFQKHLIILASFFPATNPKNVKTPAE